MLSRWKRAALGSGGALGGVISALLQVSVEYEQAPPIAVVTGNDERPEEVVAGLSSTGWANEPFDDSHLIWAPVWAQPLVRTPLLAGVMLCHLHDEPESDLHHAVDLCRAWRVPIMVAATHDSLDFDASLMEKGATIVRTPSVQVCTSWLAANAAQYRFGPAPAPRAEPGLLAALLDRAW
jgi:hypothetical protein